MAEHSNMFVYVFRIYPHFECPQLSQILQPLSYLRFDSHTGHLSSFDIEAAVTDLAPRASSIARAIASGQERTLISLSTFLLETVDRHRIPFSCSIKIEGSTPHRNAADTALHVASDWAGQPPALPRLLNTSQSP
jgi:hypothetical protein